MTSDWVDSMDPKKETVGEPLIPSDRSEMIEEQRIESIPSKICPVAHNREQSIIPNEPLQTDSDHKIPEKNLDPPVPLMPPACSFASTHASPVDTDKIHQTGDVMDIVPGPPIPSTGRGNSEDGQNWLNPSANQLFNALKRRDKGILREDAMSVSQVHSMITEQTWSSILEYERFHFHSCATPRLARFEGRDGDYSLKARFFHRFMGLPLPYDRHDWTIDRCGKEINYIIDYYAIPIDLGHPDTHAFDDNFDGDPQQSQPDSDHPASPEESAVYDDFITNPNIDFVYTIDARPRLNRFGLNALDRIRHAWAKWRSGESWF